MGNEQFQSILDSIKKDNKIETDEQFQAALKQENMTLSDLRRNLEQQMIVSRVQQNEVLSKIACPTTRRAVLRRAHDEFTSPQTITLREIFVSVPGDGTTLNVGRDEEARAKAETSASAALDGESFEKLAADLSDAPSRANAGLIGPLNLNDLSPDLQADRADEARRRHAADARPRYQILKLESISAAETMPFDKAREEITSASSPTSGSEEFQKYLEKLRGAGDHRVEECRPEEGLRRRPGKLPRQIVTAPAQ